MLTFDLVDLQDLHILLKELKLTCTFFNLKNTKIQAIQLTSYNIGACYSFIFLRLKIFRRCSKISWKDFKIKRSLNIFITSFKSIVKILFFTKMNKLRIFKNLFKFFMKIFGNLDSLKIFFLPGFSFTIIHASQNTRRRRRVPL